MNLPPEEISPAPPPPPQPAPPPRGVLVSLPVAVPRVTYILLGLTVAVYLLQLLSQFSLGYDLPVVLGVKANDAIRAGQWWRFFTPILLHGSILHIGFNMYALLTFGSGLERHYGHGRFLLLYLLSGFAGGVFSFLLTEDYSIGASGAIFGLIGAEGIFLYLNRRLFGDQVKAQINNIVFIVVVNLFLGLSPGIDNWAHIGGLLGGLVFAWFAGPRWNVAGLFPNFYLEDQREPRQIILGALIVSVLFGVLAAVGM
ncbi:MAG: rhomboid family intramembrane serine protease [Anaerolineales bacterium]